MMLHGASIESRAVIVMCAEPSVGGSFGSLEFALASSFMLQPDIVLRVIACVAADNNHSYVAYHQ